MKRPNDKKNKLANTSVDDDCDHTAVKNDTNSILKSSQLADMQHRAADNETTYNYRLPI